MGKKLEKLFNKKFNFIKNYNSNSFFFLVSRGRYANDFCNIIGSIILNKKYKMYPIVISDDYKKSYNKIFYFFGLNKFEKIFRYFMIFKNPIILMLSLFNLIKCCYFTYIKNFDWLINEFNLKSIKIGDLIYDTSTRYSFRYVKPKIDLTFINITFKSIFRTFKSIEIIEKYKPKLILIGTDFYGHNDGIMMRVGLSKKINVFECQTGFLDINRYSDIKYGKYHLKNNLKRLKTKKKLDKKFINNFYLKKVKSKSKKYLRKSFTDIYYYANRFNNQNLDKKKFFKKYFEKINYKKYKKIILLAPHVFADAPHMQGYLIFRDFYDEFEQTLKFINNNLNKKDILWISKIHPASHVYNERKIYENLLKRYKFDNLINCPKDINSRELISICDNVITSKSSIGLEFAAEGKMPILGGIAAYSNLGFSYDSKNKNDFFQILNNIEKIKKLTKKQIFDAKLAMYHLDRSTTKIHLSDKSLIMQDFKKMVDEWFLNLSKIKNRVDNTKYLNSSIKNISKNNIYNDPYYKSLELAFRKFYKN